MIRTNMIAAAALGACILRATDDSAASGAAESKTDSKAKTVLEDMDARRIFPNVDAATQYLAAASTNFTDFEKIELAAQGVDSEGNFDPEIYTDQMDVMVAVLRKVAKGGKGGGVKCIVVSPVPKIDVLLSTESGKAWATKILEKEFNHVAVRPLREADNIESVIDQMPRNIDAFISSGRGDGGGILETYNTLHKALNQVMSAKVPAWSKARLTKAELRKAMENKGYAAEYYPALENRGEGKDSLFVFAAKMGVQAAEKKGLDPAIFNRWLETRNTKTFTPDESEESDDFDIDAMADDLLTDSEPKAEEATTEA